MEVNQTSRPTAPVRCSMCVNDLCRSEALLFIPYRIDFRVAMKSKAFQLYSVIIALKIA